MATANLMDYLYGDALTKLAQAYAVKAGLLRPFPAAFYTPGANKPVGTAVKWDVTSGSREAAKVTNPDAPSNVAPGVNSVEKKVVAIGSRENYMIPLEMIQALQFNNTVVQQNAQAELQKQIKNFVERFVSLETNAVHSAVTKGKIWVADTGALQTSSSSPVRTIDYGVPTANLLTTAGAGSTYAIGDWSSAATAIVTKVRGVKQYQAKNFGFPVTDVYYGLNIPEYLAKNTSFQEYLKRNPMFRDKFTDSGEIADGTLGLRWHPVENATSVLAGTATSWAGDNYLAFSPPPGDDSWYEFIQCGLPAPAGITSETAMQQAILSAESLSAAFPIKYGLHAYTVFNADPVAAKVIVANYSVPAIKSPNAFMFGDCA